MGVLRLVGRPAPRRPQRDPRRRRTGVHPLRHWGAPFSFVAADLARQEKTITGSYFAATDAGQAIRDLCTAYVQQRLPVDKLISKRLRLQDINEALDAMLTGAEGRVVITFD